MPSIFRVKQSTKILHNISKPLLIHTAQHFRKLELSSSPLQESQISHDLQYYSPPTKDNFTSSCRSTHSLLQMFISGHMSSLGFNTASRC